jgi:hypothetical protein
MGVEEEEEMIKLPRALYKTWEKFVLCLNKDYQGGEGKTKAWMKTGRFEGRKQLYE